MVSTFVWHVEHRQELLILYGKVSVRWAAFDLLFQEILAIELGNDVAAHDLIFKTVGAGRSRIETFNRAIGQSGFDLNERRQILEITKSIEGLLPERNDIIRSPLVLGLSIGKGGKNISTVINKIGKGGREKPLSIEHIERHVENVGDLLRKLEELLLQLHDKYEPAA